jgi:hypothetical protein
MFGRSLWRILAGLVFVALLVGAVGLIGWTAYNTGLAQGAAQAGGPLSPAADGQATSPSFFVAPYAFAPFGYGFGLLGCLVPLVLFLAVFALFRLVFWAGFGGYRRWGWRPHPWRRFRDFSPDDIPEPWRQKVEELHRKLHENADREASQGQSA